MRRRIGAGSGKQSSRSGGGWGSEWPSVGAGTVPVRKVGLCWIRESSGRVWGEQKAEQQVGQEKGVRAALQEGGEQ